MSDLSHMPPTKVWVFTANVNCLSCGSGLLASWRADEQLHGAVARTLSDFRILHGRHQGFCEGLPTHGWRTECDALPPGITALSQVGVSLSGGDDSTLTFEHHNRATYYKIRS